MKTHTYTCHGYSAEPCTECGLIMNPGEERTVEETVWRPRHTVCPDPAITIKKAMEALL